jgi:hypothetical protein
VIVLLLGGLLAFAQAQAPPGYRIAGAVVNAATRQPVGGVRVTITPQEQSGQRLTFVTGPDGRFVFPSIGQGRYALLGERHGLLLRGCDPRSDMNGVIVAGPGQHTDSILLALCPPGIISGKVVDDAGDPVERAQVQLFTSTIVNGRRRLTSLAVKQTADTGDFRFGSLPSGTYYLVVSGSPWYTKFAETNGDAAPRNMTHVGYWTKYYADTSDSAAAEPLILKAGQETTANFRLLPVPAVAVHVHIEGQEELNKHFTLSVVGLQGRRVVISQGTESGDLYNFWAVPPGHYMLRVDSSGAGRAWYAEEEFDAGETELDLSATLLEAPSLNCTIEVEGGGGLPEKSSIVLVDTESGDRHPLPRGADGKLSIPALPPQRFQVALAGGDDYYLKRWSVEGARRAGETLDIRHSTAVQLKVVVAKDAGRVNGTVHRDKQPLAAALVVLAPTSASSSVEDYRVAPSASDGSYDFRGVPPGSYALFAVEEGWDFEYANPVAVRPYLVSAQRIQVEPGGTVTANIP